MCRLSFEVSRNVSIAESNMPLETLQVILETIFSASYLTCARTQPFLPAAWLLQANHINYNEITTESTVTNDH